MPDEPEFQTWYVTECITPDCWCRCISTHPTSDAMDYCVAPSGAVTKEHAEQIVAEHNERPRLLELKARTEYLEAFLRHGVECTGDWVMYAKDEFEDVLAGRWELPKPREEVGT